MLIFLEISFLECLEGWVQIAILASQSSLFWCLHVVLKKSGSLTSEISWHCAPCPLCMTSSFFRLWGPCSAQGGVPCFGFSSSWGPFPKGCPGRYVLRVHRDRTWPAPADLTTGLRTPLVYSGQNHSGVSHVLTVAPALSSVCLLMIGVLLFSG